MGLFFPPSFFPQRNTLSCSLAEWRRTSSHWISATLCAHCKPSRWLFPALTASLHVSDRQRSSTWEKCHLLLAISVSSLSLYRTMIGARLSLISGKMHASVLVFKYWLVPVVHKSLCAFYSHLICNDEGEWPHSAASSTLYNHCFTCRSYA